MAQKFTVPITVRQLSSAGSDAFTIYVDGDTFSRLQIQAGGRLVWGPGTGASDTNLYRDEANVLRTDDTFKSSALFVDGIEIDPAGAVTGNALVFDGTKFAPGEGAGGASITISDTAPSSPEQGDLWYESDTGSTFVYYDSYWIEIGGVGVLSNTGSANLDGLSDVILTSPTNGQVLKYNGTNWVNAADDAGTTINSLDDIGDVSTSGLANGQFLKWNGTAWVNDSIDLGTDTSGNYVSDITAGTGVSVTHTPSEGSSPTIAIGQAVGTTDSPTFAGVTGGQIKVGVDNDTTISSSTQNIAIRTVNTAGQMGASINILPGDDEVAGFSTGHSVSISGGRAIETTATGSAYGGPVIISGGQAFVSSGTSNGGGVSIDGGIGSTLNGVVSIGSYNAESVQIGRSGKQTTIGGNLVVSGDFTVNGTTTTLNTETLAVEDNIVVLNSGVTGSPTLDAGIEVERGTRNNVSIFWDEDGTSGRWRVNYEYTDGGMKNTAIALEGVTQLNNLSGVFYEAVSAGQILAHDGTNWTAQTPAPSTTISDTAPESPQNGQIWFESDTGKTYIRYDSSWIEVGAVASLAPGEFMRDSQAGAIITMEMM